MSTTAPACTSPSKETHRPPRAYHRLMTGGSGPAQWWRPLTFAGVLAGLYAFFTIPILILWEAAEAGAFGEA